MPEAKVSRHVSASCKHSEYLIQKSGSWIVIHHACVAREIMSRADRQTDTMGNWEVLPAVLQRDRSRFFQIEREREKKKTFVNLQHWRRGWGRRDRNPGVNLPSSSLVNQLIFYKFLFNFTDDFFSLHYIFFLCSTELLITWTGVNDHGPLHQCGDKNVSVNLSGASCKTCF